MRSIIIAVTAVVLAACVQSDDQPICWRGSGFVHQKVDCPSSVPGAGLESIYDANTRLANHSANDVFPPPEYDYLFNGPIIITRKPNLAELNRICGGNRLIGACGERRGYTCQIFMLPDDQLANFDMSFRGTLRHEIGHCNGWPGHHPDKRRDAPERYDIPKTQIFYGEPLADQLKRLVK